MAIGGRPPSWATYPPIIGLSPLRHFRDIPGNPGHHSPCRVCLSFSVILEPCSGIQVSVGNNRTGFPPSARMTEGIHSYGMAWIPTCGENDGGGGGGSFPCVSFFFRHSRALLGNPGFSGKQQDWIPAFGENDGGGGGGSFPCVSFFFRHSRALLGNPGFSGKQQDWIPAFGENDGGDSLIRNSLDSRLRHG